MSYAQNRKKQRELVKTLQDFFNMTPSKRKLAKALERKDRGKREKEIIEEQKTKFLSRGGKIKTLQPELTFDRLDPVEAIDFLMG